jgi:HpaII restriction endonuclease
METAPVNYVHINTFPLLKGSDDTSFVYELVGHYKDKSFKFKEVKGQVFRSNLILIESELPEILSHILLLSFFNKEKSLDRIIEIAEPLNPMTLVDFNTVKFYRHKVREFLKHLALGLNANNVYFGEPNLYDYYPLMENEGQMLYYSDNIARFLDIMLKNNELTIEHKFYTEANRVYLKLQLELTLR